jgi:Asp-tRNA(Asn)/Glu-tRNA(Gln) amidotransferase B subunit
MGRRRDRRHPRAHREDAGKSIGHRFPGASAVDLIGRRPLVEIVSEPDTKRG